MNDPRNRGPEAQVDFLVDENASRIEVKDGSLVRPTGDEELSIASTGPTAWWRYGLIALGIVAAILLALQLLGGTPGTDVQPGTPTAEQATPPAL